MIREMITRFNRSLSERMVSSRRHHKAPIKIWFDPDMNTERAREAARNACVFGETLDIALQKDRLPGDVIRVRGARQRQPGGAEQVIILRHA